MEKMPEPELHKGGSSPGEVLGLRFAADHLRRSRFHSSKQRIVRQMGIADSTLMIGVTKNAAYSEKVDPCVDHEARRRMTKIVDMQVDQPSRSSCRVPRVLNVSERLFGFWIGQQPRAIIPARQLLDNVDSSLTERNMPRLAGL